MFRTFSRKFLPNRLDWILRFARWRRHRTVLLCWNRGLGDIPLGVAAIVHRIYQYLPNASIHVLTRANLEEGFSLLKGVSVLIDPDWKRDAPTDWKKSLAKLGVDASSFDVVIERPLPTDWCSWQHKTFTPRLAWNSNNDSLVISFTSFNLSEEFCYVGVQVEAETQYGLWRNWPEKHWNELFDRLAAMGNVRVLLFGFGNKQQFSHPMIIDLRGKTTFLELLSIIKNRCLAMILPDSGILSSVYYLDASFPIRVVSLWGDPNHGILKQGVASPNPQLIHVPLIAEKRDLSLVQPGDVIDAIFPKQESLPLRACLRAEEVVLVGKRALDKVACVILAGGQGSRLGMKGPKGLFSVSNRSLFQHLLEKVPSSMPVAVMTSPLNHDETVDYLKQHDFFGRNVSFFSQEMIDLLDQNYKPVGTGPNGNGSLYRSLAKSGILDGFARDGVDTWIVVPIDNPLADPADERLATYHVENRADVTIKCIERKQGESMGALALSSQKKIKVIEYFALHNAPFFFSYMGQVALSTSFIRKAASKSLPFHWVHKKFSANGQELMVWKREQLLFDAFHFADSIQALCYAREECYAPIKELANLVGVEKRLQSAREGNV